jgi:eukaryotic-like serine/threonine-protein kinase
MHRTGTGVPIGTPYYMSPEQCRGRDVDHRTDVYSFGIVIYRLLTGTFPFEGDDFVELLFKQVNEEPPAPSTKNPALPASVDSAIAWMLQKDREQRPRSVIEAVNALDPAASITPPLASRSSVPALARSSKAPSTLALAETSVSSPNATQQPTGQGAARSSRGLLVVGGFVLVLVVLGAGIYVTRKPDVVVVNPEPKTFVSHTPVIKQPEIVVAPGVDAAVHPDFITVEIRGPKSELPAGTIVTLAGKQMGAAPKFSLPYATTELNLTVEAPGYLPAPLSVTPSDNQTQTVKLTKRPAGAKKPNRDDLIKFPGGAVAE